MAITETDAKVLRAIRARKTVQEISRETGIPESTIFAVLEKLKAEGYARVHESEKKLVCLTDEGKGYLSSGLPERRLLDLVLSGITEMRELSARLRDSLRLALVWFSKLGLGKVEKGKVVLSDKAREYASKKLPTEELLDLASNGVSLDSVPENLRKIISERPAVFQMDEVKEVSAEITDLGKEALNKGVEVSALTPEMIKTGSWRGAKFRRYNVKAQSPKVFPGRFHIFTQASDYVRKVWMSMGFQEMNGPIINTSFWNFDALFVPQDHPARELQDTFYVYPEFGDLPDPSLVSRVRKAHEEGVSGSKGWRYPWREDEARRLVLRTHSTVLSARTLAKLKESDLPAKFFSVSRVFRNEALDWKHLFEFTQTDGIVVSEDVNFRHLLGYLKEFLSKMGFKKVRFRPHYFPYTEMSVEPEIYHPVKREWVELGGAGIFRPEVVEPLLGKPIPVLAWGLGIERLIIDYYGIQDLREIYDNDLGKLRNYKEWYYANSEL